MQTRYLVLTTLLAALAMPMMAQAQGTLRGAQEGAAEGNHAAGPVGAVVGGAVGAVAGTVGGILGVEIARAFANTSCASDCRPIAITTTLSSALFCRTAESPTTKSQANIMCEACATLT